MNRRYERRKISGAGSVASGVPEVDDHIGDRRNPVRETAIGHGD